MDADSDVTIDKLKRGDNQAWESYYPILWPIALQTAGRKTGRWFSEYDKEDVAATAIEKLIRSVESVQDLDHLKRRLVWIAERVAVDLIREYRSQKRDVTKVNSLDEMVAEQGDSDMPASKVLPPEVKGEVQLVTRAFREVNVKYRAILFDYYIEEFTQAELAEKYSLPLGTVATYCRRGKSQLDEILKNLKNSEEMKEFSTESRL